VSFGEAPLRFEAQYLRNIAEVEALLRQFGRRYHPCRPSGGIHGSKRAVTGLSFFPGAERLDPDRVSTGPSHLADRSTWVGSIRFFLTSI